jgi:hypothetical protein
LTGVKKGKAGDPRMLLKVQKWAIRPDLQREYSRKIDRRQGDETDAG